MDNCGYIADVFSFDTTRILFGDTAPPTGWTLTGTDYSETDGQRVTIIGAGTAYSFFRYNLPTGTLSSDDAIYAKVRFKIASGSITGGFSLQSAELGKYVTAYITGDTELTVGGTPYTVRDMSAGLVELEIILTATHYVIKLDGEVVTSGVGVAESTYNSFLFGKILTTDDDVAQVYDFVEYGFLLASSSDELGLNQLQSDACYIAVNNEDEDYPAENIIGGAPNFPCKFSARTGNTVTVDLGISRDCDTVAIIKNNFTQDATVVIENATTSSFGTLGIDYTVTEISENIVIQFSADTDSRHWRVSVDDATNPHMPHIGALIIGKAKEFANNFAWNDRRSVKYQNEMSRSPAGHIYSYSYGPIESALSLNFLEVPDATVVELAEMVERTHGSMYPVLMMVDPEDLSNSLYGHTQDRQVRVYTKYGATTVTALDVTELPGFIVLDEDF